MIKIGKIDTNFKSKINQKSLILNIRYWRKKFRKRIWTCVDIWTCFCIPLSIYSLHEGFSILFSSLLLSSLPFSSPLLFSLLTFSPLLSSVPSSSLLFSSLLFSSNLFYSPLFPSRLVYSFPSSSPLLSPLSFTFLVLSSPHITFFPSPLLSPLLSSLLYSPLHFVSYLIALPRFFLSMATPPKADKRQLKNGIKNNSALL